MALWYRVSVGVSVVAVVASLGGWIAGRAPHDPPASRPGASKADARVRALQAPMVFEPNVGQASPSARFVARGQGYSVALADGEARLALRRDATSADAVLSMRAVGGNPSATLSPAEGQPGKSHYLIGSDPGRYRTDVPQFGRVLSAGIYPGIDLAYYGSGQRLEYDFIVAPGADPDQIRLRFSGQDDLALDDDGGLILHMGGRELRQPRPVAYTQPGREMVDSRFVRLDDHTVGFAVADWDRGKTLVIDPTVVFGTYLGGATSADQVGGVAVDLDGNIYVAGFTASTDFPLTGAAQGSFGGGQYDAFVTKMNASGTTVLYSTYLGGSDIEWTDGVAVDAAGSAHVVGRTMSANFPKLGPLGACVSFGGFITKLSPAGNALAYSYCIPGTWEVWAVGVDGSGSAYVTGTTSGSGLAVTNAAQATAGGSGDAFVGKLTAAGSSWSYLTYLGGTGVDDAYGLGVNTAGQVCVAGRTSGGFPLLNPRQPSLGGADDAFVVKYDAAGARVFATYLGGTLIDVARAAGIDAAGNCYATGYTFSTNFPVQNAVQPTPPGRRDAFVTAYTATGAAYVYSTFLGGSLGSDAALDLTITSAGVAHVVGETGSRDFPILSPLQPGLHDAGGAASSLNGGASFTQGLRDITVQAVAVDPTDPLLQYAGTADGIYRTQNGGATWSRVDSGLTYTDVRALAIDPNARCTIYAGIETYVTNLVTPTFIQVQNTNGVMVRSVDCGSTWGIPAGGPYGAGIHSLTLGPGNPAPLHFSILVNTVSGSTSLTSSRVARWVGGTTDYSFSFDDFDWVVAADYLAPCTSYAAGRSGQVRINSNCGTPSWSLYGTALGGSVTALAGNPAVPGAVLAGTGNGRIYRKPDLASAWQLVATVPGSVNAIIFQPGNPQIAYAAGGSGVLYKSVNGGASWSAASTIGPASSLAANPSVLSAGLIGTTDVFYARFSAAGSLLDSTWFGSYGTDRGEGVAIHPSGDVIVAGTAGSSGLPTTPGTIAPSPLGQTDAFVVRLGTTASCTYGISPTAAAVPALGGAGSVAVTTALGCGWTATSNAAFLTVTGGATGFTSGAVSYTVAANPTGAQRQGTITIAGQTFTVTQPGTTVPTITVLPTTLPAGTAGAPYPATTLTQTGGTAPATFAVTLGSLPSGLTLTPGGALGGTPTAAGTFAFTLRATDANGFTGSRAYSVTIAAAATGNRRDLAVDFGAPYGAWLAANPTTSAAQWRQLHGLSPSAMATGDIDGNGRTDLLFTFPGVGVWAYVNDSTWTQIHGLDAVEIAAGDLDGNGQDDVILSFAAYGIWVRYNNATWAQLHGLPSAGLVAGNIDGDANGRADLVVNFPGFGVWLLTNNTSWTQLHGLNAGNIRLGDLDGNGRKDIVLVFPGFGVWIRSDAGGWTQLHGLDASSIAIGNLDGDASQNDDVVLTFNGYGVWTWKNRATWTRIHGASATLFGTGDVDASGRADLALSFPGFGLWVWLNDGSFVQVHPLNPELVSVGRIDGN